MSILTADRLGEMEGIAADLRHGTAGEFDIIAFNELLDAYKAALTPPAEGEVENPPYPVRLENRVRELEAERERLKVERGEAVYEAPRSEPQIKVRGVGRDLFEPRSASVALTERPTDEELISLHEYLRGWRP